jgi:hypothetical protein
VTTALADSSGSPATPVEHARFVELTQKLIKDGGKGMSDAEMREMTELSVRVKV